MAPVTIAEFEYSGGVLYLRIDGILYIEEMVMGDLHRLRIHYPASERLELFLKPEVATKLLELFGRLTGQVPVNS